MTCGIVRTSAKNNDELAQKVQVVYYMNKTFVENNQSAEVVCLKATPY
jgi:hypothetical protein